MYLGLCCPWPTDPSLPCTWLAAVSERAGQCTCSSALFTAFNKLPLESRAFRAGCKLGTIPQQRAAGRHTLHSDPVFVFLAATWIRASHASPGVWPQNSRVSPNKLVYLLPSDSTRLLLAVKAVLNSLLEVWGRVMSPSCCLRDWGAALLCTRPYTLWCLPPATSCPWAKRAKPTGETCLRWERLYGLWTSVSSISHCWISHGKISTDLILSLNFLNITDTNRMKNVFDDIHSCQVDLSMSFLVAIEMHSLFKDAMP